MRYVFESVFNSNRTKLHYYRSGTTSGPKTTSDYTYNLDNFLTGYTTTGGPTFKLENSEIDALGRLQTADETLTRASGGTISHSLWHYYPYNSQLYFSYITNINSSEWESYYNYKENGDIYNRQTNTADTDYTYSGNKMTGASGEENFTLGYDKNGQITSTSCNGYSYVWNWDGKLRSATNGSTDVNLRYDPLGNRVQKYTSAQGTRKYIVDTAGDLATILMELDADDNMLIKKTYVYGGTGQILAQHTGGGLSGRYFYLHDRLGSVRLIINSSGNVVNRYTYKPFGELFATETEENILNPFKFTGQWYDSEFGWYYLRARMYDPVLGRFTSRDLIWGDYEQPLTLHKYLYCRNDPINKFDPTGEWAITRGLTFDIGAGLGFEFASLGFTITIQEFYGLSDDLDFFAGNMVTIGGGFFNLEDHEHRRIGIGVSLSSIIGHSTNAQGFYDLEGWFKDTGFYTSVVGGGRATNRETGIDLNYCTFGVGWGAQVYRQDTYTFVIDSVTIGPTQQVHEDHNLTIDFLQEMFPGLYDF